MKMPSKVPAEIDMDDSDIEIPEEAMMPQQKSYLWATDLQGASAQMKFEGGDVEDEMLVFKSAALGVGAKGKHVVQLSAVDAKSEKVTAILAVLSDANPFVRLPEISVEPPILLKLAEGEGPVNICANHIVTEEDDMDMDDEDDEEMEADDREEEEDIEEEAEEEVPVKAEAKKEATPKKETQKRKAEESPQKEAPKKAKNNEGKPEKKKPEKKAPKTYDTIEDLKKAILANPGGKPKKQEKFNNWVKNTMKCQKEEWFGDLWTWHQDQTKA